MHPFFHSSPFSPFFSGQLFLCCLLEGGVWRMGPFLPNCIFEGFFSLVHASLKIHLFYKALYCIAHCKVVCSWRPTRPTSCVLISSLSCLLFLLCSNPAFQLLFGNALEDTFLIVFELFNVSHCLWQWHPQCLW